MEPRFEILLWAARICAAAAVVAGLLLALPPGKRWYRLALWIAAGGFAVRVTTVRFLASAGNVAYFISLPEPGCVLLIEIALACYLGGLVQRPAALTFLCLGLLVLALVVPGSPGGPVCVALLCLGLLVLVRAFGRNTP
jgi:hypothetical protein